MDAQSVACLERELQMTDTYEQAIIAYCDNLKAKLLDKYQKGKEEHGELSANVKLDCTKEIINEVSDILIYHLIEKVQRTV